MSTKQSAYCSFLGSFYDLLNLNTHALWKILDLACSYFDQSVPVVLFGVSFQFRVKLSFFAGLGLECV